MRRLLPTLLILVAIPVPGRGQAEPPRYAFPRDESVIDAKRDLGAVGDGAADDTDALQKGIDLSCGVDGKPSRVLFLPDGTYRVTRTLVVRNGLGPWLYGQSRDGVVIRLADGAKDVTAVLRTHPSDGGDTSADWFMRNLRNFTIDVGNNPGVDGIRYHATNSGTLQHVRVLGRGVGGTGINAGFLGKNGPHLIQDVIVEGFETGIHSQWLWGQTMSRVTVRDCRKQGVYVSAVAVGIEELTVERTPVGLVVDYPNDWTWWGGVVALVGGHFSGGDPNGPAIKNRNVLYARDVRAEGFARAIGSETPGGDVAGPTVDEYLSHPARVVEDGKPGRALRLPIRPEPVVPWEMVPKRWVCVNDFGAKAGDDQDDTAAIQKALDEAARRGATTVYFRGIGGPDPNCYTLQGEVRVHGSVRRVIGLGFGRVIGGDRGAFVIDDRSAPLVAFQNIDSFGGYPAMLINRSKNRTLVVRGCGMRIVGDGAGPIFATDCPSLVELRRPGQALWARQLNPEGDSDAGLVQNHGGTLWALGVKHEGRGVRIATTAGGKTEILGLFLYGPGIDPKDERPIFDVADAAFSVAGLREIAFDVPPYPVKVRDRRGGATHTLGVDREVGWIGWSLLGVPPSDAPR